ncbi:MAG: type III-A CRISPR-associated protein Cas10/Csm1 [Desulfobacteraceae bacterium]|nr:type III-A CRISPR-associated protein Cas10/Csm1 [Desulfobacteraceae bacterium]
MNKDKVALTLGSLLHDIGKFRQRAAFETDRGKTHGQIGYEWLVSVYGEGAIASGAHSPHGYQQESINGQIIYEADKCIGSADKSSGHDADKAWIREIRLSNIFSRVRNPALSGEQEFPRETFISLRCADEWTEPVMEKKGNSAEDYKKLWKKFEEEFNALKNLNNHNNIEAVNHLLEKYTSCIPALVHNEATEDAYAYKLDVSLYDHMKITAAVALCLKDYHEYHISDSDTEILKKEISGMESWSDEKKVFALIGGDISGIQKFIYTISSKGALRSLKGRSFFLDLLSEHVVDRILEELELSQCNVIFKGGGHFFILGPNTPNAVRAAEKVREQVNDYLYKAFNGTVQQFIETISFGKNSLKNAAIARADMSVQLNNAKQCKWKDRIEQFLSGPEKPHETCLKNNCHVCGREDEKIESLSEDEPDMMICKTCKEQYLLGTQLHHALHERYPLIFRFETDQGDCIRIENSYYKISAGNEKETHAANASKVFHLNDWNLKNYVYQASRPMAAGIYLPKDQTCQDIEGMAGLGFGMNKLGVLRMDVDWLGRIFSSAVPEEERTFLCLASLSRHFALFFKHHLSGIMECRSRYPERLRVADGNSERFISVVYSGGDDLFLIGSWSDVTEAGFDIRDAFQKYTGNPFITVSAGAALGNIHDPVYRLAEIAGSAEKSAKESGKNSLTLFNIHTFNWTDARETANLTKIFTSLTVVRDNYLYLPEDSISRGELYRMLKLIREHRTEKVWMMPKLAYGFGRLRPGRKYAEPWLKLKNYIFSENVNWHHLEVAILWSLMMMRET